MSNNENNEIEENLADVLAQLKIDRENMEKKEHEKFWSEIDVPFTLHEGLNRYTKYELDSIRKRLEIKNASTLRKAELIALLQEKIPELLEETCLQLDTERFDILRKIARNGGYITAPKLELDQLEYFRESGVLYTGSFKGKEILAIPKELLEPLLLLESNSNVKSIARRNTEWIKLTRGLLYYFGTLTLSQLEKMVIVYTNEIPDLFEYISVIHNANSYNKELTIDENGYSNYRVFDSNRVRQEHQKRDNLSFYPFTKEQLLKAGEPGFVDRNKSYTQFVSFLKKNYELDRQEADELVEECVYATRIGHEPNDIIHFLSATLEFDSMEAVQAVMDQIVNLMNNTREWFLKGYMSAELRGQESLQALPTSNFTSKQRVKIGRNDPCPCGSGKKYKKCCGR
ncbi:YecA family protein [Lentibacillus sp. Marseille-P4043]|uniref:YecA family protein n=1 Tax=Lentibacillus sp. Marseille-P4043 TaxID=2040293 RepID=UPI001F405D00|nr:SEC-C metal-binding domain-containing protein [Lentibacillus sp. Marseille-P4043]